MRTMARQSILLLCVIVGMFTTTHSQGLPSFSGDFTTITDVVVPCGARCVAQKYTDLVTTATQCIISSGGIQGEITHAVNNLNLNANDYQKIYDTFFKEGSTQLCNWYKDSTGCFDKELAKLCESSVETALTKFTTDFQNLICSTSPNYLACLAHPTSISRYTPCIPPLTTFFDSLQPLTYDNYYQKLIIKTDSMGNLELHKELKEFGNCTGRAIKALSLSTTASCSTVGTEVENYIVNAINFFDFNNGGKDYMRCFARTSLHSVLIQCGTNFLNTLNAGNNDPFLTLEATLKQGPTAVRNGYGAPYKALSACLRGAVSAICASDSDSVAVINRILLPLDNFFDGNDEDQLCGTSPTSSAHRAATTTRHSLIMSGLLLLVSVLPWSS